MDNIIEPPKLPEELADVKQGRLVSHHLDQTCTHDEKSILRLQAIANNNVRSNYVQRLTVSGERNGNLPHNSERCEKWRSQLIGTIPHFPHLRELIVDNVTVGYPEDKDRCEDDDQLGAMSRRAICSCVFRAVLDGLTKHSCPQVKGFDFRIRAYDTKQPHETLLNPSSQSWKEHFAPKTKSLKLITYDSDDSGTLPWDTDLLLSIPALDVFHLEGNILDSVWPKLTWKPLHTVELHDLHLPPNAFLDFISRHNQTLSKITLIDIELDEFTWKELLQRVTELNRLSVLDLCNLGQETPSSRVPDSFKPVYTEKEASEIRLSSRDEVLIASDILINHFWTSKRANTPGYVVDFRLVAAVVNGEVEYKDGRWENVS
ncbi:uncharacterized protein SETTUDRAFT_33391 [Exserohilum turcica Et28A]|uniref:Uncharacterized protein n=1 Tax=Exserohilum turcicum (strain 28A) TaxID=671987 RepID=R0ICG4_EXST2|nr:uncharacterized protein SETTUDRAFT_33391 [Exserohilum turcica Et28A]EOA83060.1 hypothetical protein SETTUDRAFT_33391 [Exserohilum turcica Et28A]